MVTLSPDGSRVAYLAPHLGRLNIWLRELDGLARPITAFSDRRVDHYVWAGDSRHIIYLRDQLGDENFQLFALDAETGATLCLTPERGVHSQVIGVSPSRPELLAIAINDRDPRFHDAYRVDLRTGERELAARNRDELPALSWIVDSDLQVRGASRPDLQRGGGDLLVRADERAGWRVLHSWSVEDEIAEQPLGFNADGSRLFVISSKEVDRGRLLALEVDSGDVEVLAEHGAFDVGGAVFDPVSREPLLAKIWTDRFELIPIGSAGEDLRARLDADCDVAAVATDGTCLIERLRDDGAQLFVLARAGSEPEPLFEDRPQLSEYVLAQREPFSFRARDGLRVRGYLTFPPGAPRHGLPAVVAVHGGPWFRDTWGWNGLSQFLASRGYLSVQVNFRGSTGYGKAFVNAAEHEWGGKMHQDLLDALDHLGAEAIVDPDRVAILGGSYGGYAALVGAAFTPERFRCAVAAAGVSNLVTLLESLPPYWASSRQVWARRVGDVETEREFLWSRSPLSRADNISIPLLIAHGANDPRVKKAESDQLVDAVRKRGVEAEYLVFEDEGHGFVNAENYLRFAAATERFLAKHLGGRFEPAERASIASSAG